MTSTGRGSSMNRYKITYIVDEGETEAAIHHRADRSSSPEGFQDREQGTGDHGR